MPDETKGTPKNWVVSTLAMTDALANLMIANRIITDLEKPSSSEVIGEGGFIR